jgi:hypothetical protein
VTRIPEVSGTASPRSATVSPPAGASPPAGRQVTVLGHTYTVIVEPLIPSVLVQ